MVVGGPSPSVAWEICNAEADCRVRLKMTSAGSKRNDETFRVTFPKCKSRTVNGTSSSSWSSLKVTVDIWRPSFRHAKRRGLWKKIWGEEERGDLSTKIMGVTLFLSLWNISSIMWPDISKGLSNFLFLFQFIIIFWRGGGWYWETLDGKKRGKNLRFFFKIESQEIV